MRLILSRKGFDSSFGGCASPILPDGQILSLPIPHADGRVAYSALSPRALDVGQLVSDLSRQRVRPDAPAHVDPDLEPSTRSRQPGWLPAFGQDGSAQRHLDRQGVGLDDVFLFFGWFREVELVNGRYRYCTSAPNLHVLFGWLQVGRVLRVGPDPVPPWLQAHPHAAGAGWPSNTVYVAKGAGGAGVFPRFEPRLTLTEPGRVRSVWRLPLDFLPRSRSALSFHGSLARWTEIRGGCRLQSVAKGQEFVLKLGDYQGVQRWLQELVPLVP